MEVDLKCTFKYQNHRYNMKVYLKYTSVRKIKVNKNFQKTPLEMKIYLKYTSKHENWVLVRYGI